jgi:hypothetical protein
MAITSDQVYATITAHRQRSGGINPTRQQLADALNTTPRQVQMCIQQLIDDGRLYAVGSSTPSDDAAIPTQQQLDLRRALRPPVAALVRNERQALARHATNGSTAS